MRTASTKKFRTPRTVQTGSESDAQRHYTGASVTVVMLGWSMWAQV